MVPMPSSRRGTAACRIAGWKAAAKQKVMPASVASAATRSTGRSSRMPSASSTSALPDFDDAERLPCLTTRAPAPAATIAAMVEMLTDIDRSPPVPTTSSSRPGTEIGVERAYIASTRPSTSSMVSPLARRATAKPAICDGVASPSRISPIAQAVCSAVRSRRATSAESTSGQLSVARSFTGGSPVVRRWRERGSAAARRPPRPAGPGRSGAARRPRRATRSPARRPAAARSAPAPAGTGRSRP